MESGRSRTRASVLQKLTRAKSPGEIAFDISNYLFLIVFCLTVLYPIWTTVLLSFSGVTDANTLGFHFWITEWKLSAYQFAFSRYGNVQVAYFNSIYRTVLATVLTVIWTLLAAYPLSKRNLPGRNVLTLFILFTMFFSGGLIPRYLLVRSMGLVDTRLALILPVMAIAFYVIIMRNFLMTIDNAYEESAFIDGANYAHVLVRIIIPLSKPVIAVVALWTAVTHWNEWFDALIYLKSEKKIVLQLLLRRLIQQTMMLRDGMGNFIERERVELPPEAVKGAVTVLTIGPIIFLYPFLQRYFIKGIFMGSLKG